MNMHILFKVKWLSTTAYCLPRSRLFSLMKRGNSDITDLRKSGVAYSSTMGTSSSKTMKVTRRGDRGSPTKDDYVEAVVCQESDISENEMKEFELGDAGKILLIKQKGKLSAVGTKCTHYGAPLKTGVLGDGLVRCPWHGACFNITTGDIEDFPGMDSLPCYQVEIQNGGGVKVRARKEYLSTNKRVKNMVTRNMTEVTTYVVVGGGPAGATAVETLRQEGFLGRIIFICKEPALPYDRIKLSKALDVDVSKLLLRSADFYKNHGIEVMTGTEAIGINTETKQVKLSTGNELQYNAVFIATGSIPRRPPIPGADLKNIFVLRSIEEAKSISSQIGPEKHVVILGASFIGMEMAASLAGKVKSVTVIGKEKVPFERVLGERIGARLMSLHQENGVIFRMESGIAKFLPNSDGNAVGQAELSNGSTVPVDFCVLGIGSTPATKFLEDSEVDLHKGSVRVDKYLESSVKGIFAGGDIAYAPIMDTTASIGHWQLAHYHGRIAALNMLGKQTPLHTVPFFWTMLFGKGVRYAGYAPKFDDVVFSGDVDALKFVAHYCDGDVVKAVATVGSDPVAAKFAQDLLEGKQLLKSDLSPDPLAWTK